MNIFTRIINLGISKKTNPAYHRQIRLANAVALFVCYFILQNLAGSLYYHESAISLVYVMHFVLIALIPVINSRGHRVLATAWFSTVAFAFVTFYAIYTTLDSYNFAFLPMIMIMQFLLFSSEEIKYIILFSIIGVLCFVSVFIWVVLGEHLIPEISQAFIRSQRVNTLIGLPMLSLAFGVYAFISIHQAEREAARERAKTEELVLNILPVEIAAELKENGRAEAREFDTASILFTDFVRFTETSAELSAAELVSEINHCFEAFDGIIASYGIEKIKTIGDAYMAAGGLPVPTEDSVKNTVLAVIDMQDFLTRRKEENHARNKPAFKMRAGIHTGPVVAGIVGVRKFQYDIWGDTVNTASRMESSGEAGRVNISRATYELIKDLPLFAFKSRGMIETKGKGEVEMWFVERAAVDERQPVLTL